MKNNNFVTAVSVEAKDEDRQLVQLLKEEEAHISGKIVALREEVGKRYSIACSRKECEPSCEPIPSLLSR